MVYILLAWIWILFVTISLGWFFYHKVANRFVPVMQEPLPLVLYSLVGSCFLAWILAVLSFGVRIGPEVQVILSLISFLLWIKGWSVLKVQAAICLEVFTRAKLVFASFLLIAFLILLHAVQPPAFLDSGLYHIPFIKWLREYPVIPGLGNLHGRLAFNSHLHLISAFFSSETFGVPALEQAFSSYLFLIYAFWQAQLFARSLSLKEKWAIFYLGSQLLLLLFFRNAISSPMPDSSITIFILVILTLVLEKIRNQSLNILDGCSFLITFLLLTIITFKCSIIFLLPIFIYLLWQLPHPARTEYLKMFWPLCILILLPWFSRNIILSGYFYYPLPAPDVLGLDWAIPGKKVEQELAEILYFARRPGSDWEVAKGQALADWFPYWYACQEWLDKLLLFLVLTLLFMQPIRLFWRHQFKKETSLLPLFIIFSVGGIFWFFSAPAFRFGYGYLFSIFLLGVMSQLPEKLNSYLFICLLLLAGVYSLNGIKNELRKLELIQLLRPAAYPVVITTVQPVSGLPVRIVPGDGRCWNAPLPCTNEILNRLELRDVSIKSGFRIKPPVQ